MCANNDDRLVCDMCAWHATIITLLPNNNNNDGFASSFLLQHRPKFCLLQPDFTLFQETTLVFLSCEKLHATYFYGINFWESAPRWTVAIFIRSVQSRQIILAFDDGGGRKKTLHNKCRVVNYF